MQLSKRNLRRLMPIFLCILLAAATVNLMMPTVTLASPSNALEITGDGVTNPITFTREQLEGWSNIRKYTVLSIPGLLSSGMWAKV